MWRSGQHFGRVYDLCFNHQRHLVNLCGSSWRAQHQVMQKVISCPSAQVQHRSITHHFQRCLPRNLLKPVSSQLTPARSLLVPVGQFPKVTVAEVRDKLKVVVGSSLKWSEDRDSSVTSLSLAQDQSELPPRRMQDSYSEAHIPLGQDPVLRGMYINFWNSVRFGRIMEDLDTMAVWISYNHCLGPNHGGDVKSPLSVVTAMVDRIDIRNVKIDPEKDVILRGHVTWVGRTSIEVTMNVKQEVGGSWKKILQARFLMVARDPQNQVKAYVNPLSLVTEEEKALFQDGECTKKEREKQSRESLLKTPPSEEERLVIHDLFLSTLDKRAATFKHPVKPEGAVWMEDSILKNVIICFPEQRNLYNKIFGGFLMRQAYELAWVNACVYSKQRPYLIAVDDILFRKPVEIGSLLYLSSQVAYTDQCDLQVRVHAEVVNPKTGVHDTTNIFHYTITTHDTPVPTVVPKSYAEYMMYIDGKRHYDTAQTGCTDANTLTQ